MHGRGGRDELVRLVDDVALRVTRGRIVVHDGRATLQVSIHQDLVRAEQPVRDVVDDVRVVAPEAQLIAPGGGPRRREIQRRVPVSERLVPVVLGRRVVPALDQLLVFGLVAHAGVGHVDVIDLIVEDGAHQPLFDELCELAAVFVHQNRAAAVFARDQAGRSVGSLDAAVSILTRRGGVREEILEQPVVEVGSEGLVFELAVGREGELSSSVSACVLEHLEQRLLGQRAALVAFSEVGLHLLDHFEPIGLPAVGDGGGAVAGECVGFRRFDEIIVQAAIAVARARSDGKGEDDNENGGT